MRATRPRYNAQVSMQLEQLVLLAAPGALAAFLGYALVGFAGCYFSLDRMRTIYCQWRARTLDDFFLSSRSILVVSAIIGPVMAIGLAQAQ